ncbi:MAG TPA: c-type cytochrome [Terriglobales bacterium]|nr:c-type cytochrome [Terriglobales bacterium]
MKTVLTIAILVLIVVVILAGWFFGGGVYNIAASKPHSEVVRWVFTNVRDQSIDRHSRGIETPSLDNLALIKKGAREYDEECAICHGAPGKKRTEVAKGLNPEPPDLDKGEVQKKYSDPELYWIIEHGIRMTGMPAFGPTHNKEEIWRLVAFVKHLPNMKAQEYKGMAQASEHKMASTEHHPG